jgi:antitoxin CptB
MTATTRSSEGLDERRRRLLYRTWHRGTREMDLIMGCFADAEIGTMSEADVAELERLSEVADGELYAWVSYEVDPPSLLALWRDHEGHCRDRG